MKKEVEQQEEPKIIWEFECTSAKGGGVYRVARGFMLRVCDGPLQKADVGQLVGLSPGTAAGLFYCGKIVPIEIPQVGEYKILREVTIVVEGLFKRLKVGDRLELTKAESLPLLREQKIIFMKEVLTDENSIPKSNSI